MFYIVTCLMNNIHTVHLKSQIENFIHKYFIETDVILVKTLYLTWIMLFGHKNVNKLMKKYFSHKLKFLIWGTNTKRFHIVSCNAVQIEQSILKLKEGDFDGYILFLQPKKKQGHWQLINSRKLFTNSKTSHHSQVLYLVHLYSVVWSKLNPGEKISTLLIYTVFIYSISNCITRKKLKFAWFKKKLFCEAVTRYV